MEGTLKVEPDDCAMEPEPDLTPAFERHYVFLPEDPNTDVDLNSAASSVHFNQDPVTAPSTVDTEMSLEAELDRLCDSKDVVIKTEPDDNDVSIEYNVTTSTSIIPFQDIVEEVTNNISLEDLVKEEPLEDFVEDEPLEDNVEEEPLEDFVEDEPLEDIVEKEPLQEIVREENAAKSEGKKKAPKKHPTFSCTICDYRGKNKRLLTSHMRRHSPVKPHACAQCAFTSRTSCGLRDHLRTHSGERLYACEQCSWGSGIAPNGITPNLE